MTDIPPAADTGTKDERRIVIHTVCRDLLRVLARRQGMSMGKVVWTALTNHWLQSGYDSRLLFHIMDPPCPTCGHKINLPSEKQREELVERLCGEHWQEYEKKYIAEQKEMAQMADEAGLEHPDNERKRA